MSLHSKLETEIFYKEGKPSKVIVNYDALEELLERLEDQEDLVELEKRRSESDSLIPLDDYLTNRK